MDKGANFLPTGEYFINLYENGDMGEPHTERADAIVAAGNQKHRRMRLKVTNLGDTLDIFDVDQIY